MNIRYNKKQLIIISSIILILGLNKDSFWYYSIMIFSYFSLFFLYIFNVNFPLIRVPKLIAYDCIPFTFFLIWIYGVCLGVVYENNINYIFMNFAGLVMYLFYYFLLFSKLSKELIYKLIIYIGLFVLFQNLLIAVLFYVFDVNIYYGENQIIGLLFGNYMGGASTGQIRIFSPSQLVVFPLLIITFAYIFNSKLKRFELINALQKNVIIIFLLSLYIVLFLPASKGFMLAGVILIIYTILLNNTKSSYINLKKVLIIIFILVGLIISLMLSGYENILTNMFKKDDIANVERYVQLNYLLQDLKFFGSGLGSIIPGFMRNDEKPYGFELTYLNIIHKFGVISIILFLIYVYTMFKILIEFKNNVIQKKYIYVSLGLMCFLFPSIGNPILFSPQSVIMHILALYLLRKEVKYE